MYTNIINLSNSSTIQVLYGDFADAGGGGIVSWTSISWGEFFSIIPPPARDWSIPCCRPNSTPYTRHYLPLKGCLMRVLLETESLTLAVLTEVSGGPCIREVLFHGPHCVQGPSVHVLPAVWTVADGYTLSSRYTTHVAVNKLALLCVQD
jgi:hypothetical protein